MAQLGRALGSGPRGRWFESSRPDQYFTKGPGNRAFRAYGNTNHGTRNTRFMRLVVHRSPLLLACIVQLPLQEQHMTWRDKLEIGLKNDAPFRKDNLPEDQVRGPEIPSGPGRSPVIPATSGTASS